MSSIMKRYFQKNSTKCVISVTFVFRWKGLGPKWAISLFSGFEKDDFLFTRSFNGRLLYVTCEVEMFLKYKGILMKNRKKLRKSVISILITMQQYLEKHIISFLIPGKFSYPKRLFCLRY